jgi:small multidrug resistance family-3 protein
LSRDAAGFGVGLTPNGGAPDPRQSHPPRVSGSRGRIWIGAGVIALGIYGVVATWQHDDFRRILAAYGRIFVAGSIARGMVADGYRPDRWDVIGALVCLAGMDVIMYAPRGN